ncbi:C1 family peptidase, partial [Calditrichota bacterium]
MLRSILLLLIFSTIFCYGENKNTINVESYDKIDTILIEKFNSVFHFPPINQDTTYVCWSFSTTSFIETEMKRLGKAPVKLSVMFPVYYAFIEKIKYYVKTKGESRFTSGDLFGTVFDIIQKYGIVPERNYSGKTHKRNTYNHDKLYAELYEFRDKIKKESLWDEQLAESGIKKILNKYLGKPPESFKYDGGVYTPMSFMRNVVDLKWQDYIKITSFEYSLFNDFTLLKVPDNWRPDSSFLNISLDTFYNSLKSAIINGYSLAIDGDIGEPGRIGDTDMCIIPDYDIPSQAISQKAREYRFEKGLTTDDHLMHIIGYQNLNGKDWFLVKDSWRDAYEGKHKGYFFFNGDYVKLKVLAYMVHKDAVPKITKLI